MVDTGKSRLLAQVFGLGRIRPAVFDEVCSTLTKLKINLLPDTLLSDVKHPIIIKRPCVVVRLSTDNDQLYTIEVRL